MLADAKTTFFNLLPLLLIVAGIVAIFLGCWAARMVWEMRCIHRMERIAKELDKTLN